MINTERMQRLFLRKKQEHPRNAATTASQQKTKEQRRVETLTYLKQTGVFGKFVSAVTESQRHPPRDMEKYFFVFRKNAKKKDIPRSYRYYVAEKHGVAFQEVRFRAYQRVVEITVQGTIAAYTTADAIHLMTAPPPQRIFYKRGYGGYGCGIFAAALSDSVRKAPSFIRD